MRHLDASNRSGRVVADVRAVLLQHLQSLGGPAVAESDPNEMVPVAALVSSLESMRASGGDAALRDAGRSYARLWARTFRTLVRHMRGHPEHALQIFSHEVWPFLRGDRLAARTQKTGAGEFEVLVHDDLPSPYMCGLIEGFVSLSHAATEVSPAGGGRYAVHAKLRPAERLSRLAYQGAQLRIPLLLTVLLASLVGVALASHFPGMLDALDVAAVLLGTMAAQSGANAFHDLANARRAPLSSPGPARSWLWFQLVGSYSVAGTALVWLALDQVGVIAFGAIGLGLGLLYRRLRDQGYGPIIAGLSHGPLTVWGTVHAVAGPGLALTPLVAILAALPTGLLAAAILFLDDLADRPIDEAAGKRTLVMRLPRRRHVAAFAALSLGGAVASAGLLLFWDRLVWLGAVLILTAGLLVRVVRVHLDDPHGLAPARLGVLALYLACAAAITASTLGSP